MVGHARVRAFVVTDVVVTLLFVGTIFLSRRIGLHGVATTYAATYLLYWSSLLAVRGSRHASAAAVMRCTMRRTPEARFMILSLSIGSDARL
jgi:hypothetical protein